MLDLFFDEDLWCVKTMIKAAASVAERKRMKQERDSRIKKRRDELHLASMSEEKRRLLESRRISRQLRDMHNPFTLPEDTFRKQYILPPYLAQYLIAELRPLMPVAMKKFAISTEWKVLVALQYFGYGSNQRSLSAHGFSQRSCSRCISEVVEALNDPIIIGKWLSFPYNNPEKAEAISRHHRELGINGVIGFVGSMFVAITPPPKKEGQKEYCCRKNYHALHVQVACNSSQRIIDISSDSPGSYPKVYVWRMSETRKRMERMYREGDVCWLLGDAGYPLEPWLLIPISLPEPYRPAERYNNALATASGKITSCIRKLKRRFKCIKQRRSLEYSPGKSSQIVTACAVLHNMCLDANLASPEASDTEGEEETSTSSLPPHVFSGFDTQSEYLLQQEGSHNIERLAMDFH